jgi:hypothetical protein
MTDAERQKTERMKSDLDALIAQANALVAACKQLADELQQAITTEKKDKTKKTKSS